MIKTKDEFNTKYKEYLTPRFYGLDIMDERVVNYLDRIFQDLIKIPNFQYRQIKNKFGDIRFYSTLESEALTRTIERQIKSILENE